MDDLSPGFYFICSKKGASIENDISTFGRVTMSLSQVRRGGLPRQYVRSVLSESQKVRAQKQVLFTYVQPILERLNCRKKDQREPVPPIANFRYLWVMAAKSNVRLAVLKTGVIEVTAPNKMNTIPLKNSLPQCGGSVPAL
jgi:hypothetical protein